MTGILLIALGNPYYGELAANCAVTLKANGAIPVQLVYDKTAITSLSDRHLSLFDYRDEINPAYKTNFRGETNYVIPKLYLYELSCFDETLFLDADTCWTFGQSVENYLATRRKAGVHYLAQNYTHYNIGKGTSASQGYTFWEDPRKTIEKFDLRSGKIPQQSTTIVYFDRSKSAKKLFEKIVEIERTGVTPILADKTNFFFGQPDEYYFNTACALTNIFPAYEPYIPVHFYNLNKLCPEKFADGIARKYIALTNGGDRVPAHIIDVYKKWTRLSAKKIGFDYEFVFFHRDKIDIK